MLDGTVAAPSLVPGSVAGQQVQADIAADLIRGCSELPAPWHVVGHSFGGQVALEVALQRPDLVSRLALLCTRDTPYPPFAATAAGVADGRVDIEASLRRWFSPAELDTDGPAVRHARIALRDADRTAWACALEAIAVFDRSAATPSIACPTLVVAAEHDQVSDPDTVAAMCARIPDAEIVILENAWHMSVFTDPNRLAALLNR